MKLRFPLMIAAAGGLAGLSAFAQINVNDRLGASSVGVDEAAPELVETNSLTRKRMTPPPAAPALPPLPAGTTDDIELAGDLTVITSDKLEFDNLKRFALFTGNVVVSDPQMKMKADKLTVRFSEDNKLSSIVAVGRVIMSQGDRRAWAGRAEYDIASGRVQLDENPRVMRGRDMLIGDRITFFRDTQKMDCEGRTRLIVYPDRTQAGQALSGLPLPDVQRKAVTNAPAANGGR